MNSSFPSGGEIGYVVRIRVEKGLRAMKDMRGKRREDGEASVCGAQSNDSGYLQRSIRKYDAGEGSLPDGLPRTDGATLVSQV